MSTSGFLLIDKPKGWTSFDVCGKVRKLFTNASNANNQVMPAKKKQKLKVGHTGTLDPFATGLLVIAVGKATKLIPHFEKDRKVYETEIILGATTETLDSDSPIIEIKPPPAPPCQGEGLKREAIEKILKEKFTGKIQQVPPAFSALKVDGQRAYKLAREGREMSLKPRETEVFEINILEYEYPRLKLHLDVAAGFYVRALARDLGALISDGGYCSSLRRLGVGQYSIINNQYSILKERDLLDSRFQILDALIDPKQLLPQILILEIEAARFMDFREGRAFPLSPSSSPKERGEFFVVIDGQTIGLGEVIHGKLQPRILLV